MKVSFLQENLAPALTHTSRFVSAKSQLPILGNILLATDNGRLKLSATNLDLAINYWIGAKIEQEGSVTIPSKEITEFVSYLSPGPIDLSLNSQNLLSLSSSKAQSEFTSAPSTDFPDIPSIDLSTSFEIDLPLLTQAIDQLAFSAAADDTRPVLTSILCHFTSNNLTLVSTDGFRLSFKSIKLVNPLEIKSDTTFLIPARSLVEVAKIAKNDQKLKIGLTQDQNQVVFVLSDSEIVSRLAEGEYPDYQRIIPSDSSTKVYLNKSEFSQALKIASVFARQSANVVRLNIKPSSIELSANAPQIGHNNTQLEARVEGEPLEIAFSFKFISDFLNICKGDEICLELSQALSPGLFRDQSDPNYFHIIMPVRLQD